MIRRINRAQSRHSPPRTRTLGLDAIVYEFRFRCHKARFSSRIQQCIDTDSDRHCSINKCKMKGLREQAKEMLPHVTMLRILCVNANQARVRKVTYPLFQMQAVLEVIVRNRNGTQRNQNFNTCILNILTGT